MTRQLTDQDLLHLTAEQAQEIYNQGPEAVTWALLKLSALAHGAKPRTTSRSTPSSQIPPYAKPTFLTGALSGAGGMVMRSLAPFPFISFVFNIAAIQNNLIV